MLNPSGIRFGTAEIYAVIEAPPAPYDFSHAIADSLCIGQRRAHDKDERVLLFLRMYKGHHLTEGLERDIRTAIRKALSPRHVPSYIFEVGDIPVRFGTSLPTATCFRVRVVMTLTLTVAIFRYSIR